MYYFWVSVAWGRGRAKTTIFHLEIDQKLRNEFQRDKNLELIREIMGTFAGHALPGGIFIANSAVFLIRAHRAFFLPQKQNFSYLIFITEIALNFIVPLIGVILETG